MFQDKYFYYFCKIRRIFLGYEFPFLLSEPFLNSNSKETRYKETRTQLRFNQNDSI